MVMPKEILIPVLVPMRSCIAYTAAGVVELYLMNLNAGDSMSFPEIFPTNLTRKDLLKDSGDSFFEKAHNILTQKLLNPIQTCKSTVINSCESCI